MASRKFAGSHYSLLPLSQFQDPSASSVVNFGKYLTLHAHVLLVIIQSSQHLPQIVKIEDTMCCLHSRKVRTHASNYHPDLITPG